MEAVQENLLTSWRSSFLACKTMDFFFNLLVTGYIGSGPC